MPTIAEVAKFLEALCPPQLAEEWDNVGLLVGDPARPAGRVMTCLTVTPASAEEAIAERADLIVTHHPMPFRATKRLTTETTPGKLLWRLIGAGIGIHSPHTAFDSAADGINQRLARELGLDAIEPLRPARVALAAGDHAAAQMPLGSGRCGRVARPATIRDLIARAKKLLGIEHVQLVGDPARAVTQVAIACGSAGEFLADAKAKGCDLFLTGEASFHTCLEAEALGIALLLVGHYASERFAVVELAEVLGQQFGECHAWASRQERDPLAWM
jgi:dinuclear metal center YbgI/SA1388 family protein